MDKVNTMLQKLRDDLKKTPAHNLLEQFEEKTKIKYELAVIGGGLALLFLLFFGIGASIIW